MKQLEKIYRDNPRFIKEVLHLYYFKTADYFERKSELAHRMKISPVLKAVFHFLGYAIAYSIENGKYKFEFKKEHGFIGVQDVLIPFPILFQELCQAGHTSVSVDDMVNSFYQSKTPSLIHFATRLDIEGNQIKAEVFEFVKRKECDINRNWTLDELSTGNWNYAMLTLNPTIWKAFDKNFLDNLFKKEKPHFDNVNLAACNDEQYDTFVDAVNKLIAIKMDELKSGENWATAFLNYAFKRAKSRNTNFPRGNWQCNICDGDQDSGCLYHDPSECPKFS